MSSADAMRDARRPHDAIFGGNRGVTIHGVNRGEWPHGRRMMTLRDAAEMSEMRDIGANVDRLRIWIYTGVGRRKLPTYRAPGKPNVVLVDIDEVLAFHARRNRCDAQTARVKGVGPVSIRLLSDQADAARELSRRYANKIGIESISVHDTVMMAVQNELRRVPKGVESDA